MEDTLDLAPLLSWLEDQSHSSGSIADLPELLHKDLARLMVIDGKMQKIVSDIKFLLGVVRNQRLNVPIEEDELMVSGSVMEGCMLARWFRQKPGSYAKTKDDTDRADARRNQRRSTETAAASLLVGLGVHSRDASNIVRGLGVAFDVLRHRKSSKNQSHGASTFETIVSNLIREFTGGSPPTRIASTGSEMFCPNPEVEVDVMYILGSVPEPIGREAIHSTRHGPAHVTVEYTSKFDELVQSLLRARGRDKDSRRMITDGFLDSQKFKELAWEHAAFRDTGKNVATLLGLWFGVPVDNISIEVKEHPSRASHQTDLNIRITDKDRLAVSVDHVPSIHIPFWPDVAKEYLTRKRKWPVSQDIVDSITQKGCHLVPRPSSDGDQRREF